MYVFTNQSGLGDPKAFFVIDRNISFFKSEEEMDSY